MSDDASPLTTLPSPAEALEIRLAWVSEGLEPLPSFKGGDICPNLKEAVRRFRESYADKRREKLLPWIRTGTKAGSAVFNVQGILALEIALREGKLQ